MHEINIYFHFYFYTQNNILEKCFLFAICKKLYLTF